MMSYFFPAMLCSPHGEISTLKACRIIAYGLAHRFKGISYHMHAVGVREGAKHPTLGRLSFAALTCRQWQTSEAQLSHRSRKSAGCIAPDSRAALATRAACTQNHRLKSRAPVERRVHSTRFLGFSAFPDSASLLIENNAFIKSSSPFPYLNIKFYRLKVFIYISLLCS